MTEATVDSRDLLVGDRDGEFKITIPSGARVTFGPTAPFEKADRYDNTSKGWSLRVYGGSGQDTLMACFSGVHWFRDVTIPMFRRITTVEGQVQWSSDESGEQSSKSVKRSKKFVKDESE